MGKQVRQRSGRLSNLPKRGVKQERRSTKKWTVERAGMVGRPPLEPIEEMRPVIKEMVAAGLSHEKIANLLTNPQTGNPMDYRTLKRLYGRELEIGKDEADLSVARSVMSQAVGFPGIANPNYGRPTIDENGQPILDRKGEPRMIDRRRWLVEPIGAVPVMSIWYEKTRRGYKEGVIHEHTGKDGGPMVQQLVVVLPSNGRDYDSTPVLDLLPREYKALPNGGDGSGGS